VSNLETLSAPISASEVPPAAAPSSPEAAAALQERDAKLHQLLGLEYDYAQSAGLVDMFDYNPQTGEDGLIHTLAGDIDTGEDGTVAIPGGFHHEESGQLWGTITSGSSEERQVTRVDRSHLEDAPSSHRRHYRERPGEPYLAQVAIGDRPKMTVAATGEGTKLQPVKNAMYPQEYDALAVMQAVRSAYETQDPAATRPGVDHRGQSVIVTKGEATLIDGVSKMLIRLIINPENGRVKSAIPLVSGKNGIMDLSEAQMMEHATYQTPTSAVRS